MSTFALERRPLTGATAAILGALALLTATVLTGGPIRLVVPVVIASVIFAVGYRTLLRWRMLATFVLAVILFVPIKRYSLPGSLPFDLEPYRVMVALLVVGWFASLLVDPRVRLRSTFLDAPILLMLAATVASDVANPARVSSLGSTVIKALTFFVSFVLVYYVVVSVIRRRSDVDFLLKFLVTGAAAVAFFSIVERRIGFNVFDNLGRVLPVLQYEGYGGAPTRGGRFRAIASAQHPIGLSVLFVLALPFAAYLAKRTAHRIWWIAAILLSFGALSTGSRTGIVGFLTLLIVALWLRPRELLRLWPAAIPLLLLIHIVIPGAIGTVRASLSPSSLVSEQSTVVAGADARSSGRLTDIGPSLHEYSSRPLFGQGFATRIPVGPDANARLLDNQWLATLLETGFFGAIAWLWLFVRSIRRLGRRAREDRSPDGWLPVAFTASIAVFAGTMLTYDAFSFIQETFVFFMVLALAAAASEAMGIQQSRAVRAA